MSNRKMTQGHFKNGLPYNGLGTGPRIIVIFQGLLFENKPLTGLPAFFMTRIYTFLNNEYRTYIVTRKPGLPEGYSMRDMSDDYAEMIREEFDAPVDIIGVSTGGSIAQHFAADHPDLVRRLVLHSSAHTLNKKAKRAQKRTGFLARRRRWREAYFTLMSLSFPERGLMKYLSAPFLWLISLLGGSMDAPEDPKDLVITIEAEDKHNFKDRLSEITVPTLVIAGDKDPFYSEMLFRETAEGIPKAELILYEGMGHPASGKRFRRDVLAFLTKSKHRDIQE